MRDFGFNIYKAVLAAPERPKEEKNRDKDEVGRHRFYFSLLFAYYFY